MLEDAAKFQELQA